VTGLRNPASVSFGGGVAAPRFRGGGSGAPSSVRLRAGGRSSSEVFPQLSFSHAPSGGALLEHKDRFALLLVFLPPSTRRANNN